MRRIEWDALRARFDFRCGYCGLSESDKGGTLTVDHFQPQSRGGRDEESNWIYACRICNEFKGAFWPENEDERLLRPLTFSQDDHFRLQPDGVLQPLTPRAAIHIEHLKLNRPALVAHRFAKIEDERNRQIQSQLVRDLQAALLDYEQLKARLEDA